MFRKFLAILLILTLVSQSMFRLGFLTYYSFNTQEISAKYCVNKDKPDLCCQGKCYVSKQMEDKEQSFPGQQNQREELPLFETLEYFIHGDKGTALGQLTVSGQFGISEGYPGETEHPPLA